MVQPILERDVVEKWRPMLEGEVGVMEVQESSLFSIVGIHHRLVPLITLIHT